MADYILISFQKLDGIPAFIFHLRIFLGQLNDNSIDFIFDLVMVYHSIFCMMIMAVGSMQPRMVMDQRTLGGKLLVMGYCVHQNREPRLFPCRDRYCRNSQHFRQTVQVDLHTALFYDIHHV